MRQVHEGRVHQLLLNTQSPRLSQDNSWIENSWKFLGLGGLIYACPVIALPDACTYSHCWSLVLSKLVPPPVPAWPFLAFFPPALKFLTCKLRKFSKIALSHRQFCSQTAFYKRGKRFSRNQIQCSVVACMEAPARDPPPAALWSPTASLLVASWDGTCFHSI